MNRKEEFETIYNATFETLSKHVYFKVAKIEDAQDIVQEIYLDFYKYISSKGKHVENVQAYLIQMANNKLSHYYKDKTYETTLIKDEYLLESIEDESNLFLSSLSQPFLGFAFTFQIMLIESWISPNILVAPMNNVNIPITSANVDLSDNSIALIMSWICSAADAPIRPFSSSNTFP